MPPVGSRVAAACWLLHGPFGQTMSGMSRPLAWVLVLAVTAVAVLLAFTSRGAHERATPDPGAVLARQESSGSPAVELASASEPDVPRTAASEPLESASREPALRTEAASGPGTVEVRVVRAEDGSPIADAEVLVAPFGPWDHLPRIRTGRDGTVVQSGLILGQWTARAVAVDRSERVEFVTLTHANSQASVVLKLPYLVREREVHVRLVDELGQLATSGSPGIGPGIANMLRVAFGPECASPGSAYSGNRSAGYADLGRSTAALQWTIPLRSDRPVCVHLLLADRVVGARELLGGQTEVEFLVQDLSLVTGSCEVILVNDLDDSPMPGVQLSVDPGSNTTWTLTSDVEGRVRIGRLPLGQATFTASAPGFATARRKVQIPMSAPLVLRLGAPRRLQGVVLDASGAGIENVPITVEPDEDVFQHLGNRYVYGALSGPGGHFEFSTLSHEPYVVSAGRAPITGESWRITAEGGVRFARSSCSPTMPCRASASTCATGTRWGSCCARP